MQHGYIDLQVNGYAGVDFNGPSVTPEGLRTACEGMRRDGVSASLGTIFTDTIPEMARRLRRLVELRERDELAAEQIVGLHIEGPFLNEAPGYKGAHPVDAIHPADVDEMRRLLDAGGGLVKLVTLAPERDPGLRVTRMLSSVGVVVSAGHCDPTLDELDAAIDEGLTMWTHLGNGCPMQLHRHDNVIQRALSRADRLWLCFIADGVHVAFPALVNYLKLADERAVVVERRDGRGGLSAGAAPARPVGSGSGRGPRRVGAGSEPSRRVGDEHAPGGAEPAGLWLAAGSRTGVDRRCASPRDRAWLKSA